MNKKFAQGSVVQQVVVFHGVPHHAAATKWANEPRAVGEGKTQEMAPSLALDGLAGRAGKKGCRDGFRGVIAGQNDTMSVFYANIVFQCSIQGLGRT